MQLSGLISQLAGNTLNQIGRATGNKDLQIAGFATNQMGVNASAVNSFRQKKSSLKRPKGEGSSKEAKKPKLSQSILLPGVVLGLTRIF